MKQLALVALTACASAPAPAKTPAPAPAPAVTPAPVVDGQVAAEQPRGPDAATPAKPKWLGVMLQPGTTRIDQVIPGSPAQKAGVVVGDKVSSLAGNTVTTSAELIATVQKLGDKPSDLVLERGTKSLTVKVMVEDRPDAARLGQTLVGKTAPDFTVTTLDGKQLRLADLAGHVVVLDFWATWCGPCAASIPIMNRLHKNNPDVNMVAISNEDGPDISAFLAEHKIDYPIARDESLGAWRDYLVQALPTTIVIDRKGVVRHVEIGLGDPDAIAQVVASLHPRDGAP